jgi:hypothetical protein
MGAAIRPAAGPRLAAAPVLSRAPGGPDRHEPSAPRLRMAYVSGGGVAQDSPMEVVVSVIWRLVSLGVLLLSAAALVLSVLFVKRERRVGVAMDLVRLVISLVSPVLMARSLEVHPSEALMGLGLLLGAILGLFQGMRLSIRLVGPAVYARRNLAAIVVWGVGVALVQVAGIFTRTGMADLGLAVSFFGLGQSAGLLTGRWNAIVDARGRSARAVAAVALILAAGVAAAWWPATGALATSGQDLREVSAGHVDGVTVEIRGSGLGFYGDALRLTFNNTTGQTVSVAVPLGLRFLPEDTGTQTMIGAGGEIITVPPTGRSEPLVADIKAFCGEHNDAAPSTDDIFHPEDLVTGDLLALIRAIKEGGVYGYDEQQAVWHYTDGLDVTGSGRAEELTERRDLTPGAGARTSAVGLAGSALLLATTLLEGGHSPLEVMGAMRRGQGGPGGVKGLRSMASGPRLGAAAGFAWTDAGEALSAGRRVAEVLGPLPPGLKNEMEQRLLARFEGDQAASAAALVEKALGPAERLGGDLGQAVAGNPVAHKLLGSLPEGVRLRVEGRVVNDLSERRLSSGVAGLRHSLERERAAVLLRQAAQAKDRTQVDRILGSFRGPDSGQLWRQISEETGVSRNDLVAMPPLPGQEGPISLVEHLDGEDDLLAAVRLHREMVGGVGGLPAEVRGEAEERLAQVLGKERLDRVSVRIRGLVGTASGDPAKLVEEAMEGEKARQLLAGLPGGVKEAAAERVRLDLSTEKITRVADQVRLSLVWEKMVGLLKQALVVGDGDAADGVLKALEGAGAGVDTFGEASAERLLREAAGGRSVDLQSLPRAMAPGAVKAVDLGGPIGSDAEVLAAMSAEGGAREILGGLSPEFGEQVASAVVDQLAVERVGAAVSKISELVGRDFSAGSDVLVAVKNLPQAAEILSNLPQDEQEKVESLLKEGIEAEQLHLVEERAAQALRLDGAESALRGAIDKGDFDRADHVLEGLPEAERRDLARLVGLGG